MEDSAAPDFIEARSSEVNDEEWITMLVFFEKPLKILNLIKDIETLIRLRNIPEINVKRAATIFFSSMSERNSDTLKELRLEDVFYNLMLTIFKYEMEFGGLADIKTNGVFNTKDAMHSNHIIFEESESMEVSSKEQSIKDSDLTRIEKGNSFGEYDNYKNYLQVPEKDSSKISKRQRISPRKNNGNYNVVNGGGSIGFVDHGSISTIELGQDFECNKISNSSSRNQNNTETNITSEASNKIHDDKVYSHATDDVDMMKDISSTQDILCQNGSLEEEIQDENHNIQKTAPKDLSIDLDNGLNIRLKELNLNDTIQ